MGYWHASPGCFARRGYNIDSLTVGITEDEQLSRITMTVTADEQTLEQIKKQLNKLINVIKIIELKEDAAITRELVFIKVKANMHKIIPKSEVNPGIAPTTIPRTRPTKIIKRFCHESIKCKPCRTTFILNLPAPAAKHEA